MDPTKSKSIFQMTVIKMPPDLNVTTLYPPQHWTINGTSTDQVYRGGDPIRVSPSLLLNPQGLPAEIEAIASWQVVCNRTQVSYPKCCVSFTSYFNESAIPCRACACGCEAKKLSTNTSTCNATADPMLLPAYALLRPFENRTEIATMPGFTTYPGPTRSRVQTTVGSASTGTSTPTSRTASPQKSPSSTGETSVTMTGL